MARTHVELGTDIIGGEVYPGLERVQYRLRQLAAMRGGDQAYLLARELEDLRDRLRQAWGLLRTHDAPSGSQSAPQTR
jgi:cystathionine beta-lyase/cystathionine gamma-synthase